MAHKKRGATGFTLSELLIALVILGVIATFTIPKILSNQQEGRKKAIFRENIAALHEATQILIQNGSIVVGSHNCASNSPVDVKVYNNVLNYVRKVEHSPTQVSYYMHNGSEIFVTKGEILDFWIDYNGPTGGSDTTGDDWLALFFNDCNGNYGSGGSYPPLGSGRFGLLNHLPSGEVPQNKALWEEIFKN